MTATGFTPVIPDNLKNACAFMLADVERKVDEQAAKIKEEIATYTEHVWAGGNPQRVEGSWWNSLVKPYAKQIVNSYFVAQGKEPAPYHPQAAAWRLFNVMCNGEWYNVSQISLITSGTRITTLFKDHELAAAGWALEKMVNPTTKYRLVKKGL